MHSRPKPSAVIFAKDIRRVAAFYETVAEMTVVHTDADHIVLDQEHYQLVVHGIPGEISSQILITEPPEVREETPIKICIPVSGIGFARSTAAELGGRVWSEDREWEARGFRACDGFDPEGNVFQVRESAIG